MALLCIITPVSFTQVRSLFVVQEYSWGELYLRRGVGKTWPISSRQEDKEAQVGKKNVNLKKTAVSEIMNSPTMMNSFDQCSRCPSQPIVGLEYNCLYRQLSPFGADVRQLA